MPAPPQSLADYLGTVDGSTASSPVEITDPKEFAEAVLSSREFRQYIVTSLTLGELPAAVTTRLMDYAWGQPVKKVEIKDTTEDVRSLSKSELISKIAMLEALAQELPDDEGTVH